MLRPTLIQRFSALARNSQPTFAPHEILLIACLLLGASGLLLWGRWAPGVPETTAVFLVLASLAVLFRWASRSDTRRASVWDAAASFWLLPSVALCHTQMGAFVNAFAPVLKDGLLAGLDHRLFGLHLSLVLEPLVRGLPMDLLLLCYYSYFVLPLSLGVLLFRRNRAAYERYLFALTLCYAVSYAGYVLVPAVGPRFFFANAYLGPPEGLGVTAFLDGWMKLSPFLMDCFPSGHTAVTCVMWIFAARFHRRFLWIALPVGSGLIAATVIGRFHYTVDLLAALPIALGCSAVGLLWRRVASGRTAKLSERFPAPAEA